MNPSQNNFGHIRGALYSTPWAITTPWLEDICSIFERHVAGQSIQPFAQKTKRGRRCPDCKSGILKAVFVQGDQGPRASGDFTCPNCGCNCSEDVLPPYEIIDGVAILSLSGPLFPRANLLTMLSGATSYDEFGADFAHAMNNLDVIAIVIESDSPGGSCLRMSELCSQIFSAREMGNKPIYGFIDPMSCSAAYAVVSQCHEVYITESGMAGSIGTILKYNNWDRAERNEGNDQVTMTSSDIKSFGTPQSLAQYQSMIDTLLSYFEQFKDIVKRGRKKIDIEKVAGAKIWIGKEAVTVGIADGVATLEQVLALVPRNIARK